MGWLCVLQTCLGVRWLALVLRWLQSHCDVAVVGVCCSPALASLELTGRVTQISGFDKDGNLLVANIIYIYT